MVKRALIIDDEEDTEVLIRICMHVHWPDAVLEIYDPKCGIPDTGFDWERYDLLLLDFDLGLTGENGLTWLSRLIRNKHLPPVIMLTSYATDKLSKESISRGADDFLDKSNLSPELFFESVNRAISRFQANRESLVREIIDNEKTKLLSTDYINKIKSDNLPDEETQLLSIEDYVIRPDDGDEQELETVVHPPVTEKSVRTITAASKRAAQPDNIRLVVPGYNIIRKVGEGGMASIYLAENDEDKSTVILKVLSLTDNESSNLLRRFMREYKLIGQIQHENVVQIYERAFASDYAYIAMEYFEYGDLADRLKQEIDSRTAINYLNQIAKGLGAAHEKGIVHRDMKPANILFRSKDSLAITDFGIAKTDDNKRILDKQLTFEGELMGTIYYISPEQIEGSEADQRSDIYSLGVIMYKILTGKHPYSGNTHNEVFEGHLFAPIPTLPEKYRKLQPLLDGLLAKDPDERFQSTEELIMGLNWE